MSGFRWLIDQYLQLPRWERIANIVLLSLILGSVVFISVWPEKELSEKEIAQLNKKEAAILEQQNDSVGFYDKKSSKNTGTHTKPSAIYIHDLSKASAQDLVRAGLSKKVAKGMFNYLQKGGKIRNEKDVRKIYGMTDEMAAAFLKHVNLTQTSDSATAKSTNKNALGFDNNRNEKKLVNLNTADSADLVLIDGISPKMIPYILKFRTSVGSFHSAEQLNEVFKSPMKNFEHIKEQVTVDGFKPFIKINSATVDELRKHKYLKKDNLAIALVAYRDKHGKFNKPEDLKGCALVTDEILSKILPYLVFE